MKTFLKKQQGFTLIELMIVVAIIGILASIALPSYKEYMYSVKWGKAIAGIRALKLAVETCLSDNAGVFSQCDELVDGKVAGYGGIHQYAAATEDFSSIRLLTTTAAIQITGKAPLGDCILTINPAFNSAAGMIQWNYTMASGSSLAEVEECRSFVKGASAG